MPSPTPRKVSGAPGAGELILLVLLGKPTRPRLRPDRLEYLQNQRFVFA
jgi:hypothetical protein